MPICLKFPFLNLFQVFQPRPGDHEKYGGDPEQPHKLHLITRIRSGRRRPYWEKNMINYLGLEKVSDPSAVPPIPFFNAGELKNFQSTHVSVVGLV